jgi:four helix bundle protein
MRTPLSPSADAEAEAAETEVWLEMAVRCRYLDPTKAADLEQQYEHILGKLVTMINRPEQWTIRTVREEGADYETQTG